MVHQHLGPPATNEVEGLGGFDIVRVKLSAGRHLLPFAGAEIVHHRHFMAGLKKGLGHMRADEAGPAGDQNPLAP